MTTETSHPAAVNAAPKSAAKPATKRASSAAAKAAPASITQVAGTNGLETTVKASAKPVVQSAVTSTAVKKDVQKLQRAVVDGLEDVKAQDIVVFDTEHLSSLFERVIVASGTSNRQTKALAFSVLDAVRDAGFPKPRMEGEVNGEWIIVDCGQVVLHVMQPNIRTYYNLEELWGEKPVRLKLGSAKPLPKAEAVTTTKDAAKPNASLRRSSAAKKGVEAAYPTKAQMQKTVLAEIAAARKAAAKSAAPKSAAATATPKAEPKTRVRAAASASTTPLAKTAAKSRIKTLVVNAPSKPSAKKAAAPAAARKPAAPRKAPTRKA